MKKKFLLIFILTLLIMPLNVYAINDVVLSCNKTKISTNDETLCQISVNNLNFIPTDITGKVSVGDNLSITRSSYDNATWVLLDNSFNVTDINLIRNSNNKVDNIVIASFYVKAKSSINTTNTISFSNVSMGNSNYESVPLNNSSLNVSFASNINTLSSLNVKGKDIGFSSNKTQYSIEVDSPSIEITAQATDPHATVSGTGTINLNYGSNNINIVVKAEDGSTKTYTINVIKKDNRNSNNNLKKLSLSNGTIKFDKNVTEYTVSVDYDVENIKIEATPEDKKSKVEIIGNTDLIVGENNFTIKVTAENETVKEYKIKVIRDGKDNIPHSNKISNIEIEGYEINFSPNTYSYDVETNANKLNIKVITADENISCKIEGNNNLKDGSIISVIVTDGNNNTSVYRINISNYEKSESNVNIILVVLLVISIIINSTLIFIIHKKKKEISDIVKHGVYYDWN